MIVSFNNLDTVLFDSWLNLLYILKSLDRDNKMLIVIPLLIHLLKTLYTLFVNLSSSLIGNNRLVLNSCNLRL